MGKYFFASTKVLHDTIIYPRVPMHRLYNEDSQVNRICVSKSIVGCLSAIGGFKTQNIVYIYTCTSDNVIQPTTHQVQDAFLTGEEWILEPVLLTYFTTIRILNVFGEINFRDDGVFPTPVYNFKYFETDLARRVKQERLEQQLANRMKEKENG